MNPLLTLNANLPAPVSAPRGAAPPPKEEQKLDEPGLSLDSILNSATVSKMLSDGIKGGDKITITDANGQVVEISKKGVSRLDTIRTAAADFLSATGAEVSNIVAQDPAFAFKEAAYAVQSQVFSGVPESLTSVAAQGFVPMIRVVSLALDIKKATDTWKSERSSNVDKAITGGHLITDIAGLGGAVAMAIPAMGQTVTIALTAIGFVGDVAAYGYHVMKYFRERGAQPIAMAPPQPNQSAPAPNPPANPAAGRP